uniref:uncharacterized protein LOC122605810 n=1 Tax=Erigeron canadensis TaxID=72917 RepID=UPI001CB91441|nr:uncharacterized protein LOC122605810 [Erigeron canadensis]
MSRMMRSDRKPPLALRSPIRLRPRPPLHSKSLNSIQTPSSGYLTKSCMRKRSSNLEETELRPEYQTISCELKALSKMVQDNLSGSATTNQSANAHNGNLMFERGRLYYEYSARRNERLKRKRGDYDAEKKTPSKQYLGVRVESAKKATREVRKYESARKMATPMVERREVVASATTQRYSLRSSMKENKKPPLATSFERTVDATVGRKTTVRRTARKGY